MLRYKFSLGALHFAVSGEGTIMDISHPTNNVGRLYPEFFPSFKFVEGGGRQNCKKFSKRMHHFKSKQRNDRKVRILQYCPKDFCPRLQFCNKCAKQVGRKIALSDVAEKLLEILFLSRQCLSILMH